MIRRIIPVLLIVLVVSFSLCLGSSNSLVNEELCFNIFNESPFSSSEYDYADGRRKVFCHFENRTEVLWDFPVGSFEENYVEVPDYMAGVVQ